MHRLARATAVIWIMGALTVGCGSEQPQFSIPVCDDDGSRCRCMLAGFTICNHVCVNLSYDHGNCGACGKSCASGVCVSGQCTDSCGALKRCDDRCQYADSPYDCGECGNSCPQACSGGTCDSLDMTRPPPPCTNGGVRCSGVCVDVDHDRDNCGGCGLKCQSVLAICFKDTDGSHYCCNGKLCSGKCIDVDNDPDNCGECGRVCSSGSCTYGVCW